MGQMRLPFSHAAGMLESITWQPEIGLSRLDHDEALMSEIVQLLESALSERLDAMQSSALRQDFESLRQHTHAHLPSLKIMGFDQQARIFEAFESAVVMTDVTACQRLSPMVQKTWKDIIHLLNEYKSSVKFTSCV